MAGQKNILENLKIKDEDYITGGTGNISEEINNVNPQFPKTHVCHNGCYEAAISSATISTCNNCANSGAACGDSEMLHCMKEML